MNGLPLPAELCAHVVSFLPFGSRVAAARACRSLRDAAYEPAANVDLELYVSDGGRDSPWAERLTERRRNRWRKNLEPLREQLLDQSEAADVLNQRRFSALKRLVIQQVLDADARAVLEACPATVKRLEIHAVEVGSWSGNGLRLSGLVLPAGVEELHLAQLPEGGTDIPAYVCCKDLVSMAAGRAHARLRRLTLQQDFDFLDTTIDIAERDESGDVMRRLQKAYPRLEHLGGCLLGYGAGFLRAAAASRLAPLDLQLSDLADFSTARDDLAALAARGCGSFRLRAVEPRGAAALLRPPGVPRLLELAFSGRPPADGEGLLGLVCGGEHAGSLQELQLPCAALAEAPDALAALARLPRLSSLVLHAPPPAPEHDARLARAFRGLPAACPALRHADLLRGPLPPGHDPDLAEAAAATERSLRALAEAERELWQLQLGAG